MSPTRKIVLHFPKETIDDPIMNNLVKEYDLTVNILKANINPDAEGIAVIELTGSEENFTKANKYLKGLGIKTQPLSKDVTRDEKKCINCGACVVACPTEALYIKDSKTREIGFDQKKCIACESCISVCPVRAMQINFG
ncbi:NIL domain-containing protein [Nanoarchaeota archaeon]